jgi:hypothetical protein
MNHKIHILTKFIILTYIVLYLIVAIDQDPTCTYLDKEYCLSWLYGSNCNSSFPCPSEDGLLRPKHVKDIRS